MIMPLHAGVTILVVDDEETLRGVVRDCLAQDGHSVETAANGREGMAKFQAGHFDLIVSDRSMPEMNGDEFARSIKQLSPDTPFLMVTF